MPKGKKQTNEEIKEILDRYKAMGGGFTKLAAQGEETLDAVAAIQSDLRGAKKALKKTLSKLRKAEAMLNGKEDDNGE